MSLNHIVLMGRMTRDPEVRYTSSNIPVASFTLAVERDVKGEGGERGVDFIDCVAWRSGAEFIKKYFRKGSMTAVSGRLQMREWADREGNKRRAPEVVADNVYFGESKKAEDESRYVAPIGVNVDASNFGDLEEAASNPFDNLNDADGDLPF